MMTSKIGKVFDKVSLSNKRDDEIKACLIYKLSENENEKENLIMIKPKKYRVLLIACIAILSLGLMGFTFGNQIIELVTGVNYEQGKDFVSMEMGYEQKPVEIRQDRVFFILNEEDIDITDEISEDTFYQYEYTDENGNKQIIIIGGTIENIGFNVYLFNGDGELLGSSGQYNPIDDEGNKPKWLEKADKEIG